MTDFEFESWGKTPRLNKDIVVTEKIDGTNAAILIRTLADEELRAAEWGETTVAVVTVDDAVYALGAQSRNRLLSIESDNFGFAKWVADHARTLVELLGEGRHFGEWWGRGIQSGYGRTGRSFSLFNTHRFAGLSRAFDDDTCLEVVPVLYQGPFNQLEIQFALTYLRVYGSVANGWGGKAEGVVVFHTASRQTYKAFCENDDIHKGELAHA